MYDILDNVVELQRYANLCNNEQGEACFILGQLAYNRTYLSDKFVKALREEIKEQLTNFQENSKIVEKTRIHTETYEELLWLDVDD